MHHSKCAPCLQERCAQIPAADKHTWRHRPPAVGGKKKRQEEGLTALPQGQNPPSAPWLPLLRLPSLTPGSWPGRVLRGSERGSSDTPTPPPDTLPAAAERWPASRGALWRVARPGLVLPHAALAPQASPARPAPLVPPCPLQPAPAELGASAPRARTGGAGSGAGRREGRPRDIITAATTQTPQREGASPAVPAPTPHRGRKRTRGGWAHTPPAAPSLAAPAATSRPARESPAVAAGLVIRTGPARDRRQRGPLPHNTPRRRAGRAVRAPGGAGQGSAPLATAPPSRHGPAPRGSRPAPPCRPQGRVGGGGRAVLYAWGRSRGLRAHLGLPGPARRAVEDSTPAAVGDRAS